MEKEAAEKPLERGDLVRLAPSAVEEEQRLRERKDALGRIADVVMDDDVLYTVEWVLGGGKTVGLTANQLVVTSTDQEGSRNRRKRKPVPFMDDAMALDEAKRKKRQANKQARDAAKATKVVAKPKAKSAAKPKAAAKAKPAAKPKVAPKAKSGPKPKATKVEKTKTEKAKAPAKKKKADAAPEAKKGKDAKKKPEEPVAPASTAMDTFKRHRREFERIVTRLEKLDPYGYFLDAAPAEFDEVYEPAVADVEPPAEASADHVAATTTVAVTKPVAQTKKQPAGPVFPSHAPYNWEMIRRRMAHGRYFINRQAKEESERFVMLLPYYQQLGKKRPRRTKVWKEGVTNPRVLNTQGIDWDVFRDDVVAMCDAAVERSDDTSNEARGTVVFAARKLKEEVLVVYHKTGLKQMRVMAEDDDRHKFYAAINKRKNAEAAMQSWRQEPFQERRYERLLESNAVCDGLSDLDKRTATYELRTNLPDSFVGLSYKYDDTGQSEAWMKSVVDETAQSQPSSKEREAALALAADDGVTRAQVMATMQSLLIGVQDRVMTDAGVLRQDELRSANWIASGDLNPTVTEGKTLDDNSKPAIVEQPVWGLDCYTRRNILTCLETEFDPRTALLFIEKWLLPAINACPVDLGHDISNAARLLEGLPFEAASTEDSDDVDAEEQDSVQKLAQETSVERWTQTLLGQALREKIRTSAPPWLAAAAHQLRRARAALGVDFFRVHPKGHGSVLLAEKVKANSLVTFYRGEVYPSWRWGEKMDAIEITQQRKNLKPALPDFYNMALERPQSDPRGYGMLFVDASRKAGHGSSLSHSCDPTCEVRVAASNGELTLAMTTLRELEMGEELTFDYNAVTESLNEYRSAVCLCGYGKCRGSFLHFATADCYQQVLNRNAPIATRFANLVKGSMKQVMSEKDETVLRNHGFSTAVFGAISANRRAITNGRYGDTLVDSIDIVPVWLRTFVADALRYIEYERRALPIALLCDHLATVKKKKNKIIREPTESVKEPKAEPAFFFFSRTQTELLRGLLNKEGVPDSIKGLELKHKMQKVASTYWQNMSEETKQFWKDEAATNYAKKKKAWLTEQKELGKSGDSKKVEKKKKSPPSGMTDLLSSSSISFQDADAEGVSAMEQRIQQLTQTLSRVGRVLDRDREESLKVDQLDAAREVESLRERVHAPLSVMSDDACIAWMWNRGDGVVRTLLRCVEESACVRPELLTNLRETMSMYTHLEAFKEGAKENPDLDGASARMTLSAALLDLRSVLLREVKGMTKTFREFRAQSHPGTEPKAVEDGGSDVESEKIPVTNDLVETATEGEEVESALDIDEVGSGEGSRDAQPSDDPKAEAILQREVEVMEKESSAGDARAVVSAVLNSIVDEVVLRGETISDSSQPKEEKIQPPPWVDFYGQRFTLLAAADLLLFYAKTRAFFVVNEYRPLKSTPIEVYARELGNAVPVLAIDGAATDVPTESSSVETIAERTASAPTPKGEPDKGRSPTQGPKPGTLCEPDDIVSEVTVTYTGDYVLSQLLQWYNGGIGQKPGIPDMLGCTLLPAMDGCWSSELLRATRLKADRKTTYETKIRPRLVEWLTDPFQRGNPWPIDIRRAFEAKQPRTSDTGALAFGSPVMDFLVTGDDSSIFAVLDGLDADDKISSKLKGGSMLTSVDKGRPAQAVSKWVQCEKPDCLKWRKVPWNVDEDLLPEKFFCSDNKWNPDVASCDALEEDWDDADALVGADGKVEGSPIRKKATTTDASLKDPSAFKVGARFDVLREGKDKYSVGRVTKVDFSGKVSRIMFHFPKVASKYDEWIEFGSPRIAPLHSRTEPAKRRKPKDPEDDTKPAAKKAKHASDMKPISTELDIADSSDEPKSGVDTKSSLSAPEQAKSFDRPGPSHDAENPGVKSSRNVQNGMIQANPPNGQFDENRSKSLEREVMRGNHHAEASKTTSMVGGSNNGSNTAGVGSRSSHNPGAEKWASECPTSLAHRTSNLPSDATSKVTTASHSHCGSAARSVAPLTSNSGGSSAFHHYPASSHGSLGLSGADAMAFLRVMPPIHNPFQMNPAFVGSGGANFGFPHSAAPLAASLLGAPAIPSTNNYAGANPLPNGNPSYGQAHNPNAGPHQQ